MKNKLKKVSEENFYNDVNLFIKIFFSIFIKGDGIVILPFWAAVLILTFVNYKFALLVVITFLFLRYLGEMFYWIASQFGDKNYRPYDFGLKSLKNNSIYIIYQLISLIISCVSLALLIWYSKKLI